MVIVGKTIGRAPANITPRLTDSINRAHCRGMDCNRCMCWLSDNRPIERIPEYPIALMNASKKKGELRITVAGQAFAQAVRRFSHFQTLRQGSILAAVQACPILPPRPCLCKSITGGCQTRPRDLER